MRLTNVGPNVLSLTQSFVFVCFLLLALISSLAGAQDAPSPVVITASTVTIAGPTVTTYIDAPTTPPSPQYTDALTLRTSVLNSTNLFRFQHNASFVAWNETLAAYAQSYSAKCIWAHSYGPQGYGENLAHGYGDITSGIDAWGDERALYVFAPPDQITGFSEATGHFTQLVWKSTTTVGCGVTECNGKNGVAGFMLVCAYWPAGNVNRAGGNKNMYFEEMVESQVVSGTQGFDTFSATAGATGEGGQPTSVSGASTAWGGRRVSLVWLVGVVAWVSVL